MRTDQELAHKFLQWDDATLKAECQKCFDKVQAIQRSKQHKEQRPLLSVLQSQLHRMKMEIKRRDDFAKRVKYSPQPSKVD